MNLLDAFHLVKKGELIRRPNWTSRQLGLDVGGDRICPNVEKEYGIDCSGQWVPTISDLEANDWQIVK